MKRQRQTSVAHLENFGMRVLKQKLQTNVSTAQCHCGHLNITKLTEYDEI